MIDRDALLPCPFCGGIAEMDTEQSYVGFVSGKRGTAIAIYCLSCDANMAVCREDVPSVTPEYVAEKWNARVVP